MCTAYASEMIMLFLDTKRYDTFEEHWVAPRRPVWIRIRDVKGIRLWWPVLAYAVLAVASGILTALILD